MGSNIVRNVGDIPKQKTLPTSSSKAQRLILWWMFRICYNNIVAVSIPCRHVAESCDHWE
jgi:hypothetical protein